MNTKLGVALAVGAFGSGIAVGSVIASKVLKNKFVLSKNPIGDLIVDNQFRDGVQFSLAINQNGKTLEEFSDDIMKQKQVVLNIIKVTD